MIFNNSGKSLNNYSFRYGMNKLENAKSYQYLGLTRPYGNFTLARQELKKASLKGPLKYLVAKLHGCYPGANSLPVSQNFFGRFFRRRPVADSSRCLTFLLRCNKHKKHFLLTFFFLLMFFFTVTTSEWCLYFLNLAVLLANFIHVRTY